MSAAGQVTLAGALYLVGMAAGVLSVAPSVDNGDYLVNAAASRTQVRLAACFQLIMGTAYVGAAVALYPVLSEHGEALALGFLGFRLIAGALAFVGTIILLLLLALSEEYTEATPGVTPQLQTVGALLRMGRDLTNHVGMILAHSIGGFLFYSLLFRVELIPRWLSVWGLVGVVLAIMASLLVVFRVSEVRTKLYVALTLPIALQEAVLAIWLVTRGLSPTGH